jgi:hypothetical protein
MARIWPIELFTGSELNVILSARNSLRICRELTL